MIKTYTLIIKSHCSFPDYENTVEAESREEAIDKFYNMLEEEFSKDDIDKDMDEGEELPYEHTGDHEPYDN